MKIKGWNVYINQKEHKVWNAIGLRAPSVRLTRIYIPKTKIPLYWKVESWMRYKLRPTEKIFETKKESEKYAMLFMKKYK
jgi:hypothetical protein